MIKGIKSIVCHTDTNTGISFMILIQSDISIWYTALMRSFVLVCQGTTECSIKILYLLRMYIGMKKITC